MWTTTSLINAGNIIFLILGHFLGGLKIADTARLKNTIAPQTIVPNDSLSISYLTIAHNNLGEHQDIYPLTSGIFLFLFSLALRPKVGAFVKMHCKFTIEIPIPLGLQGCREAKIPCGESSRKAGLINLTSPALSKI